MWKGNGRMNTWKDLIFKEPLEPPKLTSKEIFEAGKRGNLSAYDAATRKCARLLYNAAQRNCMVGKVLGQIHKISGKVNRYLKEGSVEHHQLWQEWFLDLNDFLHYVLGKEEPEISEQMKKVGASGFMWSLAVQAAIGALREDDYFDEFMMWPKRGHIVKEGTCPRCHIPIQKSWKKETEW